MKKRVIRSLGVLGLCLALLPVAVSAASTGNIITYSDVSAAGDGSVTAVLHMDTKTLAISGKGLMLDWSSGSSAPWAGNADSVQTAVIESGVTSVGANAFQGCIGLTRVTIPSSVTSIGDSAFENCSGLTSISIPSSVTSIGISAFEDCTGLTDVLIPSGVAAIADSAFEDCAVLSSVSIPSGVTSIGVSAFENCPALTSVTIPEGVTSIGSSAFGLCTGLASVTIPGSVTSIGIDAIPTTATVIAPAGSAAEAWAQANGLAAAPDSTGANPIPGNAMSQAGLYTYVPEPLTREDFMAPVDEDLQDESPIDYNVSVHRATGSTLGASWEAGTFSENGEEEGLAFRTNGRPSNFSELWVNGQRVPREMYTFRNEDHQTILVLESDFLSALTEGRHSLTIRFTDGSAEASFTVRQ